MTDYLNWRLKVERGRQTWIYLESEDEKKAWPQTDIDRYWLGILNDKTILKKPINSIESASNGLEFYSKLQSEDGHFSGEYGGPMFLMPGIIIAMYVTSTKFPIGYNIEMIKYLKSRANSDDGGWGL